MEQSTSKFSVQELRGALRSFIKHLVKTIPRRCQEQQCGPTTCGDKSPKTKKTPQERNSCGESCE